VFKKELYKFEGLYAFRHQTHLTRSYAIIYRGAFLKEIFKAIILKVSPDSENKTSLDAKNIFTNIVNRESHILSCFWNLLFRFTADIFKSSEIHVKGSDRHNEAQGLASSKGIPHFCNVNVLAITMAEESVSQNIAQTLRQLLRIPPTHGWLCTFYLSCV
jgi:hypothetical protein